MMFRILLLIKLTSCVCGTFVVNVTQTSYQAEENQDITLEWTFTTKPDMSLNSLYIYCDMINDHFKNPGVFHLYEGVEVSQFRDEQFAGRVQFNKDVLREGRIRLHVSRLRTEDSGLYTCDVKTNDGVKLRGCRLNVTAAADESKPQRPTVSPQAESRGRTGLYAGLGLTAAAAAALLIVWALSYAQCKAIAPPAQVVLLSHQHRCQFSHVCEIANAHAPGLCGCGREV